MFTMRRFTALLAVSALAAVACGSEASPSGAGGASDDMTVTIESPDDGAEVAASFAVELSSSEELGPPDSGKMHVHLTYDGNEDDYDVVESDSYEVADLAPGEHTIEATLRNADHSPAGPADEITVTVAGGDDGGEGDKEEKDDGYDDGGGY